MILSAKIIFLSDRFIGEINFVVRLLQWRKIKAANEKYINVPLTSLMKTLT